MFDADFIEPLMNLWYDDIGFAKKMVALLKLKLARLLKKMGYRRECLV